MPIRIALFTVIYMFNFFISFNCQNAMAQQESGKKMKKEAAPEIVLETVLVNARKISEDIKQVPFSLSVVTDADLRQLNINNSGELYRWLPNFNFTNTGLPFANLINIRGVGSSSAMITPSVNYYVDGIPVPARVFDSRFLDVEQIELLRGPQGTLYGLNSIAGVVNIKTFDPGTIFGGELGLEYGSYGRASVSAMLEGPLSENVSARLSGQFYNQDGDINNYLFRPSGSVASIKRQVGADRFGALRGKIKVDAGTDSTIILSGAYSHDKLNPSTGLWLDDPQYPRNAYNPVPESTIKTNYFSLNIEHEANSFKFTSLTGFYYYDLNMEADILDGFLSSASSGLPPYHSQAPGLNVRTINEDSTQFSQEFRFDGLTAGGTRWVAGLNAFYSDLESTTDHTSQFMPNGAYTGRQKTTNLAAFGEVTVPLTTRLRWIGGLRANYIDQDFNGYFTGRNGARPYFYEEGTDVFKFLTGRTGFSFDFNENVSGFVSVARGEKNGAYPFNNPTAAMGIAQQAYKSAKMWSYEAGLRGRALSERLNYSASIFFNDTKNEQLFSYNPSIGRISVQNADTESYGAELELAWLPIDNLSVTGNMAWLHTKVVDSVNTSLIGNKTPYSPHFTAGATLEYRHPATFGSQDGELFGHWEYQYVGCREIDPANSRTLDSYEVNNLRAGWRGDNFDIYVGVENLFDEKYALSGFQNGLSKTGQGVYAAIPGSPRTYSIGLRWKF